MSRLVKNQTTDVIQLNDIGVSIPPSSQVELTNILMLDEIANSENLICAIMHDKLVLNDGTNDLNKIQSLDVLRGYSDPTPKTGPDNKLMVYESSRPLGTKIYFSCVGDSTTNENDVGNGQNTYFEHNIDDSTSSVIYIDYNTIENESYLHEGYIMWYGAKGDNINLEFVPRVTPVTPSGGTSNYNLIDINGNPSLTQGYLIVPAAPGTGNINVDITSMVLVQVVPSFDYGKILDPAYWDADFNTTTKQFENIRPNYTGTGGYNMFAAEVFFSKFVNKMTLLDKGFLQLQTAESEQLPHNIRCKITMNTNLPDHEWSCSCIIVLHRKKTV